MRTLKFVIESQFLGEIRFGIEKWLNITGIRMSQGIKVSVWYSMEKARLASQAIDWTLTSFFSISQPSPNHFLSLKFPREKPLRKTDCQEWCLVLEIHQGPFVVFWLATTKKHYRSSKNQRNVQLVVLGLNFLFQLGKPTFYFFIKKSIKTFKSCHYQLFCSPRNIG